MDLKVGNNCRSRDQEARRWVDTGRGGKGIIWKGRPGLSTPARKAGGFPDRQTEDTIRKRPCTLRWSFLQRF
jgi:hypothetical protein